MDVLKEFYPKLLEILPVEALTTQFFAKGLLSNTHKEKLDGLSAARAINKEKAKYFLDEVLIPGLKIGFVEQFDEMLVMMRNSDEPPVKFLANEITKSRNCHVTPTVHGEDTHFQGECLCVGLGLRQCIRNTAR